MAEFNDSFVQFNSVLMDVNSNESNEGNHILEQCDSLLTNIVNVEPVCNKTNASEVSEEFIGISDIDVNVPKCSISTGDVIVSNGGISADNENISDVFITSEDIDASNGGISANDVNVSNVYSSSGDVDVFYGGTPATDEIIPDTFITGADASNGVTSADDVNVSNGGGIMLCDFSNEINDGQVMKDEEFHDAVQFFKDPSSLNFLETVGASNTEPESLTRSSLYVNFDPLHARFNRQPTKKSSEISEVDTLPEVPEVVAENFSELVLNKHLTNVSPQETVGNILISFDSPVKGKPVEAEADFSGEPPKLYTENELQQIVKDQELNLQETFMKKLHELERIHELKDLEVKTDKKNSLCAALHHILKEVTDVAISLSVKNSELQESLENAVKDNAKLQEDLKTSVEDLQSVENTFTDFHKRYEQCKGMVKVYVQNEINMKHVVENLKIQLVEKDEIYGALKSRTEEMLDKSNVEIAIVKKASDASVAVLDAQLKKSELKISSLENELKHVKIENSKLTSICDELMTKVSNG